MRMSEHHPSRVRCSRCGRQAKRIVSNTFVQPVINEYFDVGLNRPIKGRTHLRDVQRELGVVDAAPLKDMKPSAGWR